MSDLLRRPSIAFLVLAGATAGANAAFGLLGLPEPLVSYLPIIALVTAVYGAAWLAFELVARSRARRWLGWLSFAVQLFSVALAFIAHFWTAGVVNAYPGAPATADDAAVWWSVIGAYAYNFSGYVAVAALAPILPAIVLALAQPRRIQQA